MDKSTINLIDEAFKNKGKNDIILHKKGINDAEVCYLFTKETQSV